MRKRKIRKKEKKKKNEKKKKKKYLFILSKIQIKKKKKKMKIKTTLNQKKILPFFSKFCYSSKKMSQTFVDQHIEQYSLQSSSSIPLIEEELRNETNKINPKLILTPQISNLLRFPFLIKIAFF